MYIWVHSALVLCVFCCILQQREGWMDRRTLKRDKGDRLDLQQHLKTEIAAKTRIQDQLTEITSQLTDMEK